MTYREQTAPYVNRIEVGHVLDVLREMSGETVHCMITSPPYWGLRDYKTEAIVWGDDPDCEHEWGVELDVIGRVTHGQGASTLTGGHESWGNREGGIQGQFCQRCSAWRGSLGAEPTPDLYVQHLVQVFRELKRVLRDDGVLFLNLGDTYATTTKGDNRTAEQLASGPQTLTGGQGFRVAHATGSRKIELPRDLKPGDLCNIPHRVASALQADGWWWRSTIIWAKGLSFAHKEIDCPHCGKVVEADFSGSVMPESLSGWRWERHRIKVKEQVYKGEYRDEDTGILYDRTVDIETPDGKWIDCPGCPKCDPNDGLVLRKGSWRPTSGHEYVFMLTKSADYFCDQGAIKERGIYPAGTKAGKSSQERADTADVRSNPAHYVEYSGTRNPRSVWAISSKPYPEAHFSTFSPDLVIPCIRAGTSEHGCCPECGSPWVRMIATEDPEGRLGEGYHDHEDDLYRGQRGVFPAEGAPTKRTAGWRPSCSCGAEERIPCLVLDPFMGSGTVARVAQRLSRSYFGIDLSAEYAKMAGRRTAQQALELI